MEIITGVEQRRSWPLERKLAVLEEASRGAESAASVARRHDIRPQQLYRWRRELRHGRLDGNEPEPPTFLPISLPTMKGAMLSRHRRWRRVRTAGARRPD